MTRLARRQREFLAALRGEGTLPPSLAHYRGQLQAGWRAALADTYPVTERLVGPAFFAEAARRYAIARPSRSGDLHAYGEAFAAFLATYEHAAPLPWLADMARLEWALHAAQFAADAPPFDAAALAAVPTGRHGAIRLRLHPAVSLLRSTWPLVPWWEANQPGRDGTPVEGVAAGHGVLVTRADHAARPWTLDAAEWTALEAWTTGATLAEVADALGDGGARLPSLLARLFTAGAFRGFDLA